MNIEIKKGIQLIKKNDTILSKIIEKTGEITFPVRNNLFESLVKIILSQQLSNIASKTIIKKLDDLLIEYKPEKILQTSRTEILSCGISKSKYNFIVGISTMIMNNELNLNELDEMTNNQVFEKLIEVKGLGPWSINIFLISGLHRLDILPLNDVGIQNSIQKFYGFSEKVTNQDIITISSKWKEYSSLACLYLWSAYDNKLEINNEVG